MICVCVINHRQRESIQPMLEGLRTFGNVLFVLDRCFGDGSAELLDSCGVPYIECCNRGHGAGQSREAGFQCIMEQTDGKADILFLDGDRIPTGVTESLCETAVSLADVTQMCVEHDIRAARDRYPLQEPGRFMSHSFELYNANKHYPAIYNLDNYVYTCGILISNRGLKRLSALQDGELFHHDFYGEYGYEDTALGIVMKMAGLTFGWFPSECRIAGCLNGDGFQGVNEEQRRHIADRYCGKMDYKLTQMGLRKPDFV